MMAVLIVETKERASSLLAAAIAVLGCYYFLPFAFAATGFDVEAVGFDAVLATIFFLAAISEFSLLKQECGFPSSPVNI
jgi:hypothetical protein